jgi:glycosyltransferase involved in cell wall biosynthesis
MNTAGRLFFDISYTRTQTGSVGITRTVRQLAQELQATPGGCVPVAFHTRGFRAAVSDGAVPDPGATSNASVARLLRYLMSGPARRIVSEYLPHRFVAWAWRLHSLWAFNALSAREVPVEFRPGDMVVLADQSWNYQAWVTAARAREQGAKVILLVHDLIPLRHPEFCDPLFTKVFENWLAKMVSCVDAIVCNSEATQEDLLVYLSSQHLHRPATAHIKLGSDLHGCCEVGNVRNALESFVGGTMPCFLAVGTVEPRKNYSLMLEVFEQLWATGAEVRLLICGRRGAGGVEFVERLAMHKEQGRRLLWIADASDSEIACLYLRCRALIFPSVAEGFGLPLVEARTRGCPVIASDLPVFVELADAGVWLFARHSAKALSDLVLHHAQRDRRREAGFLPAFTWKDSAEQLLKTVFALLCLPPARA